MQFEHELSLKEVDYKNLPLSIKSKVNRFKQMHAKVFANPNAVDEAKKRELIAYSAVIADNIQDFIEKDLPDEGTQPENQNPNNMTKKTEDAEKAAVAAANEAEKTKAAAEAKAKADADKAAADTAKGDTKINVAGADTAKSDADKAADAAKAAAAQPKTRGVLDKIFGRS